VLVVNGQGPVPAAATIDRFKNLGLELIPGTGLLAACVPGAFGAWMLLLRDHGTLRPREVLEPAIGYAETGFPAVPRIGGAIGAMERLFRTEWPTSAEVWLADGVPAPGGRLRTPPWRDLAPADRPGGLADRDGQIEAALAASTRASWPRPSPATWPRPRS
jgi:gamma-glutamyltranspeptidase/glutathione hydrolase